MNANRSRALPRSLRNLAGMLTLLLLATATPALAADWDGDGSQGNFSWWNNWSNDRLDWQVFESATPLNFNSNNSGQSTLLQDIGWKTVQSIIYKSTFSGNTTLNDNGSSGFDLWWKIERAPLETLQLHVKHHWCPVQLGNQDRNSL